MKTRNIQTFISLILLLHFNLTNGQNLAESDILPLDPSIQYGELDNGFKYYIKPTYDKDPKLHLSLIVNAGTNHEDQDQVELSHFLEHMAFKSSQNFPHGLDQIIKESTSLGLNIFDVNAQTTPKSTIYLFKSPVNNKPALDLALLWFEDIAKGKLKLTDKEIDQEKGAFTQEYITGGGDNFEKRLQQNKLISKLIPGVKVRTNLLKDIENMNYKALRRYYKDWYRPDLMAISIVGNIRNTDSLERAIQERFSDIPVKKKPRLVTDYDSLYFNQEYRFAKVLTEDSLDSEIEFQLFYKDRETFSKLPTMDGAYQILKWNLLTDILNQRLKEKSYTYNSFYTARSNYTYKNSLVPLSLRIIIKSEGNKYKKALAETAAVLKQLYKYGVGKTEFDQAIERQLDNIRIDHPENTRYWSSPIRAHLISGEALPADKLKLLKTWLSNYNRPDFNSFIRKISFDRPESIGVLIPAKFKDLNITENLTRDVLKGSFSDKTKPYTLPKIPERLMSEKEIKKLQPSEYIDLGFGVSGAKELILENGIKIMLYSHQPEGVNENDIFIHGFTPIGAMNFPKTDYFSAVNSAEIILNSGVGELNKFELQRFLSPTSLNWHLLDLYINNLESGIEMHSSLRDLEIMLQVIRLHMQKANASKMAFTDWKANAIKMKSNTLFDIKSQDLKIFIKDYFEDHSGVTYGTRRFEGIEKTKLDRAEKIYNQIFNNSERFTFIINGNFSIDSIIPLVNKYLGTLPVSDAEFNQDVSEENYDLAPKGPVYKEFAFPGNYTKKNNLYMSYIIKKTTDSLDWRERIKVKALGAVTNTKMWGLRFDKGYPLYSPGAGAKYNMVKNRYEIHTYFNTEPAEIENLRKEFKKIMIHLKTEKIPKSILEQSLERMLNIYNPETGGNTHRWVQKKLYNHYRFNLPWVENLEIHQFIKELTPSDIQETAKKYFQDENLFEFVIKEKKEDL
ncbi:putative Zn-dependent peptidase [Salegentibacter sp. 24]|uniref:M16 family metallopeptidase n=1 Tax=Salegentibacter sp. 24 TaxID=2183986 RepID=UPI00105E7A10|nr:insulinase family protein [Salegentibacter sp. 24]TDN94963.1 putative Zn-dependent peptidase [Salegentibacter sp. 24]